MFESAACTRVDRRRGAVHGVEVRLVRAVDRVHVCEEQIELRQLEHHEPALAIPLRCVDPARGKLLAHVRGNAIRSAESGM
jgi:hypothetical protein